MTQTKTPTIVPCPTCKKSTEWDAGNPFRPFCCERCKLIDLGAWATEEHSIAGEPTHLFDETDSGYSERHNDI